MMKDLIQSARSFSKIEFWAVTTLFVFAMLFFITEGLEDVSTVTTPNQRLFKEAGIRFHFYKNYFVPRFIRNLFLFLSFLLLNFVLVPKMIRREAMVRNIVAVLLLFLLAGLVLGITDTYLENYLFLQYPSVADAHDAIFKKSFLFAFWLLMMFVFYSIIKYGGIYLHSNAAVIQEWFPFVTPVGLKILVFWAIGLFLLLMDSEGDEELVVAWCVLIPTALLLYWFAFYRLIPGALVKKRAFLQYMGKVLLVLTIAYLPVSLLLLIIFSDEDVAFAFNLFNMAFQFFVTSPLLWVWYKRQLKGREQIDVLQRELGRSNASFDFLRSQINPHFLFNALNTIYGTAIQEKAERTSEGIERLGDMMRFMLQENMQEKISLAREIDYLNNYIALQKLRTDPNPSIRIKADIEEQIHQVQIAPMLLIPFVENAFKHGISFREPSHINVLLEMKENVLYFDVNNSRHTKQENDPEQHNTGIGLNNVKQRLQLLYPGRHELIIRETTKEYFIHLTITLS